VLPGGATHDDENMKLTLRPLVAAVIVAASLSSLFVAATVPECAYSSM
jgi:hypothetical protein